MVRNTSCIMSIPSSASVDSQLTGPWGSHYTSTDVPTVASGFPGRLWQQETQPQYWTKFQVWEWLQQTLDVHQIDATSIPFQNFDIDGRQLCAMSFQDFTRAAGSVGPLLYQSLTELRWNGQYGSELFAPLDIKTEVDDFSCSILPYKEESCFYSCTNTDLFETKDPFPSSIAVSTPASPGTDTKKLHSRPQTSQMKKHNPRGTHLWEFIRDILLNPERNPGLIKWEDRSEGVFRFLKSEAVAQLWGKKKNNSSMTYEKLSRAMRYYYKREILERVDGRRLVYKFGRNARGWKESDK
ncbi:ETS homologous factor [Lepisosteus oculatus]|uniref:ETS homologous factor n=1 Tax=Lepisosteus oculatus TaxID=7918 RepID=W5LZE4_LEPOC|nr:PREDICTED: ETS homologous factor [Lepisosteus oculatus]XP_015193559.1 PREDICTED: ETS homologous factor [Lepisosteus oculatus]XP_015193560.1 PREDICTED: ETS homologous factor [Lepisosteus oculatus]